MERSLHLWWLTADARGAYLPVHFRFDILCLFHVWHRCVLPIMTLVLTFGASMIPSYNRCVMCCCGLHVVLCHDVSSYVVLCHVLSRGLVLCQAMPCHTIPCHAMPCHSKWNVSKMMAKRMSYTNICKWNPSTNHIFQDIIYTSNGYRGRSRLTIHSFSIARNVTG